MEGDREVLGVLEAPCQHASKLYYLGPHETLLTQINPEIWVRMGFLNVIYKIRVAEKKVELWRAKAMFLFSSFIPESTQDGCQPSSKFTLAVLAKNVNH